MVCPITSMLRMHPSLVRFLYKIHIDGWFGLSSFQDTSMQHCRTLATLSRFV
uniref:Uncharacterized protein n=1 Tax=Anopheles minimus TaxID=112268 RepID=A0A182WPW7_9DIPT